MGSSVTAVMLEDMRSQPDAVAEAIATSRAALAEGSLPAFDRLVLTGSGDSWIASCAVEPLFRTVLQPPVFAMPSLDASRYLAARPGDLVVVLSVSGEVARTIEVARRASASGAATLAITAGTTSTLAQQCDTVLPMPAPVDRSIPHSRDYTAMLATLATLAEHAAGTRLERLDGLPATIDEILGSSLTGVERLVTGSDVRTWFLGAGPDRATAMFGAMKFWEAAGMEAWWDDLEEFGHGSQLMARPGDRAVTIASGPGEQRAREMAPGLKRMGLDLVTVGASGMALVGSPHLQTGQPVQPAWHPFLACIPVQALTFFEAQARGVDVSIALDGRPYAATYDEIHVEWTKRSEVLVDDAAPASIADAPEER